MSVIETQESRTAEGRFAPGISGNPAGRPKGALNKATLAAAALLDEHGEGVLRALIEKALGGDVGAARFIVDRIDPRPKGEFVAIAVDPGKANDLFHIHECVLAAALAGEISVEAAAKLSRIIATAVRLAKERRRDFEKLLAWRPAAPAPQAAAPAPKPEPKPEPTPARRPEGAPVQPPRPAGAAAAPAAAPGSAPQRPAPPPLSDLYFSTALARGAVPCAA